MSLQWQGDWLVLSGSLGVVVRLDRSSSIAISVDHEFWERTQGLCGLYNGRPEGMLRCDLVWLVDGVGGVHKGFQV